MNNIVAFMLITLLLSVESSLQTSVIWCRSEAWWTPWLYKVGPISIADAFIITTSFVTVFNIIKSFVRRENPFSRAKYFSLCVLTFIYLGIGFIYNLTVYSFWKTFLYDFKVVLYLTVPYFFLRSLRGNKEKIRKWFTPEKIFIYYATASFVDVVVVNIFGQVEYPSYLNLPVLPVILPVVVCLAGLVYSESRRLKVFFAAILFVDIVGAINRLSLGYVFSVGVVLAYFSIIRLKIKTLAKYVFVLAIFLAIFFFQVWIVSNPIGLVRQKRGGAITRTRQFQNVLMNYDHNIPILIGKGLGSTWFEYMQVSKDDIYSVGTSVGRNKREAMAGRVRFIFNFKPAGILYKWGIMGTLIVVSMIIFYFQGMYRKVVWLDSNHICSPKDTRHLMAILIILFMFMMDNFTYIGSLRHSFITSLLAFYMDDKMNMYGGRIAKKEEVCVV